MTTHERHDHAAIRLGAIDCGSNAIRMVIADVTAPGEISRIAGERAPIRLGRGAFTRGELDSDLLLVGSPRDDTLHPETGSAFAFELDSEGTDWEQTF